MLCQHIGLRWLASPDSCREFSRRTGSGKSQVVSRVANVGSILDANAADFENLNFFLMQDLANRSCTVYSSRVLRRPARARTRTRTRTPTEAKQGHRCTRTFPACGECVFSTL